MGGRLPDAWSGISANEFEIIERSLAGVGEWAGELKHSRQDGRVLELAVRFTRLNTDHAEAGRLLIANDVTERNALQRKLERSQRMESLGSLASGIAHDMNNLLTPVLIGAEMLTTADSQSTRDSLQGMIRMSAERAVELLKQILSFAKGTSTAAGPVELGAIIRQIAELVMHSLPKNIQFNTQIAESLSAVQGPASKIDQIVMNLCVNARDAMPKGGQLLLQAENRDFDEALPEMAPSAKPGPFVAVTVTDTGTGMPPEILARIFDPFFTTKEPGKGTGLGLATTREIVTSMGGFIRVASQPGHGTRFEIYLPALAAKSMAKPDSKEMPIGNGELILVVDDDLSIQELASRILETYGYRVVVAGSPIEAVQRCREVGPELRAILLDMLMPGQTFDVTLDQLKHQVPTVPIILTTGTGGEESEGPGFGEASFLAKPYTAAQLLQMIRKVLGVPATR
jgi:signal transduction histidine kinase